MKTPLCGMLTLAAIYFTAQTTTPPTGKVGINTTEPTETLDVKGKVRIQGLYSENDQTGTKLSETDDNKTFTATDVVTANANGVLGKKPLSDIIAAQTPNFPWKKVGTTDENAVPNYGLKMYSKYAVGIGDYSAASSSIDSSFEINGGGTKQLGLINGNTMWHISTENKSLTFTKRKPDNGRIFSVTTDANAYLGNSIGEDGSSAKIILNGKDGKIGVGKNSADYNLDVVGDAKISGLKDGNGYTATHMVVADTNGVLGKANIPSIPTEPWQVAGGTTQATANNQNIYQNGKVGIGNYSSNGDTIGSVFEIKSTNATSDNGQQFGLINGPYKWHLSTENTTDKSGAFTLTKRNSNENGGQARVFSLTKDSKIYLGGALSDTSGGGAKIFIDGKDGKIGINKGSADYALDVNGQAKISTLNDQGSTTTNLKMVVADTDGVLKKADIPSIPTIPTEPWRQLGSTTQATANTDNIYQKGKVGIGDYTNISTFNSDFEVNSSRNGYHVGIANGADTKWNLSAENDNEKPFTITRRHSSNNGGEGRVLSLTKDTKLYLGSNIDTNGNRANILVDGKNGKIGINKNTADHHLDVAGTAKISDNIFLNDKWNIGLKGNSLMFYSSGTKADTNNKFTLTNEGKLFLGKDMNGDGNGTGANVFLDGKDGKVAIGKNSADYKLDVAGDAKISGLKDGNGYTATHMVVADANGVLGKANIPTIPTEPWQVAGGTIQATANNQKIYQNNKVGIGDYSSTDIGSNFEINGGGSSQLGLINGTSKWDISTEDKALTFTKRKPENGRIFSITDKAIIYLGNTLLTQNGSGAKLILDGGNGKIGVGKNSAEYNLDVAGNAKISGLPDKGSNDTVKMVVVDNSGVLKKADIPSGNGNGVKNHTSSNDAVQCNASNAGTIHYKEGVTVNKQSTSVMGFCMKTADNKYRWFYIFGGAGTTTGSAADTPNFGDGL